METGYRGRRHVLRADLAVNAWGSAITLPKGTRVILVKGADGLKGDRFAVRDIALLIRLTGNGHDPKYRHLFVDAEHVETVED